MEPAIPDWSDDDDGPLPPDAYRALYPEPALCREPELCLGPAIRRERDFCPEPEILHEPELYPEPAIRRELDFCPEPARANAATFSHAASGGLNNAQVHASLSDLKEHVMLMHEECIKCVRESNEHVERKLSGIRHDIATLRDELKQEFASLRLDFAKQYDDIRAKLTQILSFITRPAVPSPASQQYPPPRTCEASASQPESVNRMLKRKSHPEVERIEANNVFLPQTPVNDNMITIFGATNGEWLDFKEGWRYRGANTTSYIISIPKVCGYNELVEKLFEELDFDRCLHDLVLTASFNDKFPPVPIRKDEDVEYLISLCGVMDKYPALCVNTKTKNM